MRAAISGKKVRSPLFSSGDTRPDPVDNRPPYYISDNAVHDKKAAISPNMIAGGVTQTRQRRGSPVENGDERGPLDSTLPVDPAVIYRNLWLFVWLKTIGSFDSGAFSAALGAENGIAEDWMLTTVQQGTLTSSVFLGNVLGCPLSGHLFSKYSEKHVLNASLLLQTVATFLFASFPTYYMSLINRFFIGLSLAFTVVYTPVWVDAFAPKEHQSIWMASHNAGVPLGIMLGYFLGAFFPSYTPFSWEWAFYIKCVLMIPTMVCIARVDTRSLNAQMRNERKPIEVTRSATGSSTTFTVTEGMPPDGTSSSSGNGLCGRYKQKMRSVSQTMHTLLGNPIFLCSVLAMCSLYFVATGLQNFVTQYLRGEPFNASMRMLMAGFGASVVTAPVCGVIVGGLLLDKLGGYQGNLLRVALFELFWGGSAAFFAIICIFLTNAYAFLVVMSVVLFCGGALIPPGAGLTMSSLPEHLRSIGAAFSQTLYNLLGNFSGPMVCGFVADYTGELKYGIMTLLLSSTLGLIPIGIVLLLSVRMHRSEVTVTGTSDDDHFDNPGATVVMIEKIHVAGDVLNTTPPTKLTSDQRTPPCPKQGTRSLCEGGTQVVPTAAAHRPTNDSLLGDRLGMKASRRISVGEESELCLTPTSQVDFPVQGSHMQAAGVPPPPETPAASLMGREAEELIPRWTPSSSQGSSGAMHGSPPHLWLENTIRLSVKDSNLNTPQQPPASSQQDPTESLECTTTHLRSGEPQTNVLAATATSTRTSQQQESASRRRLFSGYATALNNLEMEDDSAAVKSLPGPHAFGMDLVRTWLHSLAVEVDPRMGNEEPPRASASNPLTPATSQGKP